ncbi:MAG: hypothetical protein V4501_11330 [Pseudomonadota bacterium]
MSDLRCAGCGMTMTIDQCVQIYVGIGKKNVFFFCCDLYGPYMNARETLGRELRRAIQIEEGMLKRLIVYGSPSDVDLSSTNYGYLLDMLDDRIFKDE